MDELSPNRLVAALIYPGVTSLDATGPLDVLAFANQLAGRALYRPMTVSHDGAAVPVAGDFACLAPSRQPDTLPRRLDMLLLPGGPGSAAAARNGALLDWLQALGTRCARIGAICNGARILAAAGLAGRAGVRVAPHWTEHGPLRGDQPAAEAQPARCIVNGPVWTSSGVVPGFDIALSLIERDAGPELAREVARRLILALRPTPARSAPPPAGPSPPHFGDPRLDRVRRHVESDPGSDLGIAALATVAGMSRRTLQRQFKAESGMTLGSYVGRMRIETARALLETSRLTVTEIARRTGFGTADSMRRSFRRAFGMSPLDYRDQHRRRPSSG